MEVEILRSAACGDQNKETAVKLHYSFHTLKFYKQRIMVKLGARNIPHAISLAYEQGYLP